MQKADKSCDEIIVRMVAEGTTMADLIRATGKSSGMIQRRLRNLNLVLHRKKRTVKPLAESQIAKITSLRKEGYSIKRVCQTMRLSLRKWPEWAKMHDFPSIPRTDAEVVARQVKQFTEQGLTVKQIAKKIGLKAGTVASYRMMNAGRDGAFKCHRDVAKALAAYQAKPCAATEAEAVKMMRTYHPRQEIIRGSRCVKHNGYIWIVDCNHELRKHKFHDICISTRY
jgi:transposase-like protein